MSDTNIYVDLYNKLGIPFTSIDENYNPDDYGKALMAPYYSGCGVSYSYSTKNNITNDSINPQEI